jgi:hypothetical protein
LSKIDISPLAALNKENALQCNLREGSLDDTLVVTLSWNKRLTMNSIRFPHLTLDLADVNEAYYILNADVIVESLLAFIRRNNIRKVCFTGISKGGFGSLLISRELSALEPSVAFSCLAFSPQTMIWPENPALSFGSYKRLLVTRKADQRAADLLAKYGNVREETSRPNLKWLVFFGLRNVKDRDEALALSGSSVHLEPVDISAHGSLAPFLGSSDNPQHVREMIAALYRSAARVADLQEELLTTNQEKMYEEILALPPRPNILKFLEWILRQSAPGGAPA